MAQNFSWFVLDPKAGDQLQQTQTINVNTAPEVPAPFANLGDRVQGNNNSVWVFVQASTTVTAGNAVVWDNQFKANNATTTLAATAAVGKGIGIAQFYNPGFGPVGIISTLQVGTAQPGDYFWVANQGTGLVVNITSTAGTNAQLYLSTGNPGLMSSTAATVAVRGLFSGTVGFTNTGSNITTDAYAQVPMAASQ